MSESLSLEDARAAYSLDEILEEQKQIQKAY